VLTDFLPLPSSSSGGVDTSLSLVHPNLHLLAAKQEHKEQGQLNVVGREVE